MAFLTIANKGDVIQRDDGVTGICVAHRNFHEERDGFEIESVIWLVYCKEYDRNIIAVMDDGKRLKQEQHEWTRLGININPAAGEVLYER